MLNVQSVQFLIPHLKLVPAARLTGPVCEALHAAGPVRGALHAAGPVRGALHAVGPVRGALHAAGPVRGALHAAGPFSPAPPAQARARGEGLASLFLSLSHCLSGSLSIQLDQSPFFKTCIVFLKFNYFLDTTCITCTITSDLHFFNAIHFQNYGRNSACRII